MNNKKIVIVVTLMTDLTEFSIILGALFIILAIVLGIYLKEEPDEYSAYIKNKKRILRTYNSIIVEVEDIPNIAGKNIIKVKSIEDLVDAQLELREPIYYKNDNDSCFFMLLHYNEACIYILKMNDGVVSPTEQSIRYMKEDKDNKEVDENILDNLENTISILKKNNISIYGTSLDTNTYITDINKVDKYAVIFGNEANGVRKEINDLVDKKFKIEMHNDVESLNVAVACAIVIYHFNK